jgi:hypothetical protein
VFYGKRRVRCPDTWQRLAAFWQFCGSEKASGEGRKNRLSSGRQILRNGTGEAPLKGAVDPEGLVGDPARRPQQREDQSQAATRVPENRQRVGKVGAQHCAADTLWAVNAAVARFGLPVSRYCGRVVANPDTIPVFEFCPDLRLFDVRRDKPTCCRGASPCRKGNSESILPSSLAWHIARCVAKRRSRHWCAG